MEAGVRSLTESGACHPDDRLAALSRLSWARQIVVDDFEFTLDANRLHRPTCLVTKELRSGTIVSLWRDQLGSHHPFRTGSKDTVLVAHAADAEMACYATLGWAMPRIFDTFVETRNHTNIATSKHDERTERCGLLDALAYFGISPSRNRTTEEKDYWRQLFINDGPWTPSLQAGGLDYCADDMLDTEQLFYRVLRTVSLPEAFNRGRFMAAAAKVERVGIPIYMPTFVRFRRHRETLMRRLIEEVNRNIGIYVGTSINQQRFAAWLRDIGIDEWPLTDAGHLKTDKDTFRDMEGAHPSIERLKELQKTLTGLKNNDLEDAIGADGRNRTGVRPFGASSSRNTPRAGEFVFGQAKWNRCLIKPEPGYSIGSFDYKQQEYAIAAVYSGDKAMLAAYQSGDPYKATAIQAGFEPTPANRSKFKTVSLGIQYGAGPSRLSRQLGLPRQQTRELVQLGIGLSVLACMPLYITSCRLGSVGKFALSLCSDTTALVSTPTHLTSERYVISRAKETAEKSYEKLHAA